jgi:hypothetical protein
MTVEIKVRDGVRNDVTSERFTPRDLLVGNNVDIDGTGKLSRRLGRAEVSSGAASSLWSDGMQAFYVRSSQLYQLHPDYSSTSVATGVNPTVSYGALDRAVYWTDNKQSGRVKDGVNTRWGIEVPTPTFEVSTTFGDLPAGTYGVTITYLRNGMESGAPRGKFLAVPENGAIRIQNIPTAADTSVDGAIVYITRPDGEIFFRSALLGPADTDVTVYATHEDTLPLRTQFKGPAPAGHTVGFYAGRSYVGQGSVLFYSDPYEYELFDLGRNFIQFEGPIRIFAPVNDGVFVATDRQTFFLAGREPSEFVSSLVLPFGGVQGTLTYPRNDEITDRGVQGIAAMWVSHAGVCLGTTGGGLVNMTGDRYELPTVVKGGGLFKMRSGTPQYVSTLFN